MITPRPSSNNLTPKPGFPMNPFFGIEPVLMTDKVRNIPLSLSYCLTLHPLRGRRLMVTMCQVTCVYADPGPQWLGPYMVTIRSTRIPTLLHTLVSG